MKYTDPDGDMIQLKSVQSRLPCRVASARTDPLSTFLLFQDPRRLASLHRGPRVGPDRTPRDHPRADAVPLVLPFHPPSLRPSSFRSPLLPPGFSPSASRSQPRDFLKSTSATHLRVPSLASPWSPRFGFPAPYPLSSCVRYLPIIKGTRNFHLCIPSLLDLPNTSEPRPPSSTRSSRFVLLR